MASLSAVCRTSARHHIRRLSTAVPSQLSGGPHAFDPTIRRLARSKNFTEIESILETLKNPPNPLTELHLSSIITNYACAGMLDHAVKTLAQVPNPTAASLNSLLSACNHHPKLYKSVPDLFQELIKKHSIALDKVSYGILIKSHCKAGKAADCFKILKEMEAKNVEITTITYTTILDSLYKEKKPQEAEKLWTEMKAKGVALDGTAFNVRVMHKEKSGAKPENVLRIVEEMEAAGLKPDVITYNCVMMSYLRHGKFKEAKKVYVGLKEKGLEPNYTTYKSYMMALCKNGDLEAALEVFNEALKQKKVPDLGVVRMLVEGLVKQKKMRAAKRVVTGLRKKFSEDFTGGWLELEKIVGLNKEGEEEDEEEHVVAA